MLITKDVKKKLLLSFKKKRALCFSNGGILPQYFISRTMSSLDLISAFLFNYYLFISFKNFSQVSFWFNKAFSKKNLPLNVFRFGGFIVYKRYMTNDSRSSSIPLNHLADLGTAAKVSSSRSLDLLKNDQWAEHYTKFGESLREIRGIRVPYDIQSLDTYRVQDRVSKITTILDGCDNSNAAVVQNFVTTVQGTMGSIVVKTPGRTVMSIPDIQLAMDRSKQYTCLFDNLDYQVHKMELFSYFHKTHSPFIRGLIAVCGFSEMLVLYSTEHTMLAVFTAKTFYSLYYNLHQVGQMTALLEDLLDCIEADANEPFWEKLKKHIKSNRTLYAASTAAAVGFAIKGMLGGTISNIPELGPLERGLTDVAKTIRGIGYHWAEISSAFWKGVSDSYGKTFLDLLEDARRALKNGK